MHKNKIDVRVFWVMLLNCGLYLWLYYQFMFVRKYGIIKIPKMSVVYEKPYSDCFNFGFDVFCGVLTCFCTSAGLQSL